MEAKKFCQATETIFEEAGLKNYIENICGYKHIHSGKVRDTYKIDPSTLLVVASDRISIFDFILSTKIPYKGIVLTALTHFCTDLLSKNFPVEFLDHLIPSQKNPLFNAAYDLKADFPQLPIERCLVVKNLIGQIDPYELIFRHHLGGSVYEDYQATGIVSGQEIEPKDLPEWSYLPTPIFTPSTKQDNEHDQNIPTDIYYNDKRVDLQGKIFINLLQRVYSFIYEYAKARGILILDTKFEGSARLCMVADEIFTPDSSRFVAESNWIEHMNNPREIPLEFFDKQLVRDWGKSIQVDGQSHKINIAKLDPSKAEDQKLVEKQVIPEEIVEKTIRSYFDIFQRLTGMNIVEYSNTRMGIKLSLIPF